MNKKTNIFLWMICAVAMNTANANVITFTDSVFNNSDWTISINISQGPFSSVSYTGTQVASGGNAGDYRHNTRTWGLGTSAQVFNINTLAVYDPSTQGAISSISFSQDINGFGGGGIYGDGLLLEQDGQFFIAAFVASQFGTNAWQNRSSTGLTAADFSPFFVLSHPDFSATGDPITFGYVRTNTLSADVVTVQDGIDNWSVSVTASPSSVPEPATIVLIGLGLGVMSYVRRRKTFPCLATLDISIRTVLCFNRPFIFPHRIIGKSLQAIHGRTQQAFLPVAPNVHSV